MLFRLLPPASLLVGHVGSNAIVMGGFEYFFNSSISGVLLLSAIEDPVGSRRSLLFIFLELFLFS